jgi:hypothetical protein
VVRHGRPCCQYFKGLGGDTIGLRGMKLLGYRSILDSNPVDIGQSTQSAITGDSVTQTKSYENNSSIWTVPVSEKGVLEALGNRFAISKADFAVVAEMDSTEKAAEALNALQEPTAKQQELLDKLNTFRGRRATLKAIDLLVPRTPKFLYFSHYDRMAGEISIDKVMRDNATGTLSESDKVFLDFLEYAGTSLDELASASRFEEMNAKCEAAANRITDQIFQYWSQNDQLAIDVRLDAGRAEDPAPFNSGTVARARVRNSLHRVTVPFSERSAGFVWFFSFLVRFAQIKREHGNVIILLDEPGLTLHGTAQKDLLRYFKEQLEQDHQLIYSTHSPFMVSADELMNVRTVEDVVDNDRKGRAISHGTKVRGDVLTTDPQTNFPVFGAMGFEVTQSLIIAPNTLLVEGPGDILYVQAVSNKLRSLNRTHLHPKWAICPAGGIDKVLPFVRLFRGNNLNMVVLTDFDRGQTKKLEGLYKAELLQAERIILATDIVEQEEADIEDFFYPELFVQLVNETYALSGSTALTVEKLSSADESTTRQVKKAEAYFAALPPELPTFGHFDPASYLIKNPAFLDRGGFAVEWTLARFESAFTKIAQFE